MPESRAEQIAMAVAAQLRTIVGDGGTNYWYTPSRVVRVVTLDQTVLDTSMDVVYAISADRQEEQPRTNGPNGIIRNTSYLTLTLLKRYAPSTENPFKAVAPTRLTLQERMLRDVRKKLRADVKLTIGGLDGVSTYVALPDAELEPESTFIDGWACAFARCVVTSHYVMDTP
jgi:hypothetical protein